MDGIFGPTHIIILLVVLVILFGSKKLPHAARSLGESMRIFKAETKALHDDGQVPDGTPVTQARQQQLPPQAPVDPTQQQILDLQRQVQDLQRQPAGDGTTVNGGPLPEAQRTQQPS